MRKWSKDEVEHLIERYPHCTLTELSEEFGRSIGAIAKKCSSIGLRSKGYDWRRKRLNSDEKLWLRLNYPHMSNEICAIRLKCGWRTVVRKARELGLKKSPEFMKECQAHTAKKARESHLRNGTYPAKGWYSPNLQKGEIYQFKKK